jgi:hypothetical protein
MPIILFTQGRDQDGHGWMAIQANSSTDHISEIPSTKECWQSGLIFKLPKFVIQAFK